MTTGDAARPIAGRLIHVGGRVFILALLLPTSLPIPLGVSAPPGIVLLTWAFAGLAADDPSGPRGLLVLACDDTAEAQLRAGQGGTMVATHFRDLDVALSALSPTDTLSGEDRALLTRAVLSAVDAATVDHLPDLIELIGEPAAALPADEHAPELTLQGRQAATLSGTLVPNHLLLRTGASWSFARVAQAELEFGEKPRMSLGLEQRWGALSEAAPDRAIALHAHGFSVLRIGAPR